MNCEQRPAIARALRAADRVPATELEQDSPFEPLVAVMLSPQATDVRIDQPTRKLYTVANRPEKALASLVNGLDRCIRTIGLFGDKVHKPLRRECSIDSRCEPEKTVFQ